MEMLFESLGDGVICKRGGEKWICADITQEGRVSSPLLHASFPSIMATGTGAPGGSHHGRREGSSPRRRGRTQSQLSPEHRLVSHKLLIPEQWVVLEDCHKQDGPGPLTLNSFESKVEATLIHLSFSAVSWRGRRGLVSGTRDSHAKRPRAPLKLR